MKKIIREIAYRVDTILAMVIFGLVYGIPFGLNVALGRETGKEIIPIGFKGTEKVLPNNRWAFLLLFFSPILMIWRGPITINIGHSLRFSKETPEIELDQKIAQALLETLDEVS